MKRKLTHTTPPWTYPCAAALLVFAASVSAQPAPPAAPPAPPAPEAPAQPQPDAEDAPDEDAPEVPTYTREDRLAQLADEDHAVREAATFALLQDDTIDEPALAQLLASAEHPEQRRRLLHIAEHHLMRVHLAQVAADLRGDGPPSRAAVGFSYGSVVPERNPLGHNAAFVILDTMPGFPGHAHLLPGDLILAIEGETTQADSDQEIRNWVGLAIGRFNEGEPITLTIRRDGETADLTLDCAALRTLNEVYTTTGAGESARTAGHQDYIEQALARLTDPLEGDAEALAPAPAE